MPSSFITCDECGVGFRRICVSQVHSVSSKESILSEARYRHLSHAQLPKGYYKAMAGVKRGIASVQKKASAAVVDKTEADAKPAKKATKKSK